jgi:hypothetical protein
LQKDRINGQGERLSSLRHQHNPTAIANVFLVCTIVHRSHPVPLALTTPHKARNLQQPTIVTLRILCKKAGRLAQ